MLSAKYLWTDGEVTYRKQLARGNPIKEIKHRLPRVADLYRIKLQNEIDYPVKQRVLRHW